MMPDNAQYTEETNITLEEFITCEDLAIYRKIATYVQKCHGLVLFLCFLSNPPFLPHYTGVIFASFIGMTT